MYHIYYPSLGLTLGYTDSLAEVEALMAAYPELAFEVLR